MYKNPPNKIIYADPNKCVGCHSCEMACAIAHSSATSVFEAVGLDGMASRTHVVAVDGSSVPMQCRHCEDAPCTKVCPTGAIRQAEGHGNVQLDEQSCIGCKMCSMVCPFGVITIVQRAQKSATTNGSVATKCDLCIDWREANDKTMTACQEACPTKAIDLVDLFEYRSAILKARAAELAAAHKAMSLHF